MNDDLVVQKILKLLENNTAFIGYALNGGIGTKINVRNTETGKTIQALSINVDSTGEVLVVKDSSDNQYKAVTFKTAEKVSERIIQLRKTKPVDDKKVIEYTDSDIEVFYLFVKLIDTGSPVPSPLKSTWIRKGTSCSQFVGAYERCNYGAKELIDGTYYQGLPYVPYESLSDCQAANRGRDAGTPNGGAGGFGGSNGILYVTKMDNYHEQRLLEVLQSSDTHDGTRWQNYLGYQTIVLCNGQSYVSGHGLYYKNVPPRQRWEPPDETSIIYSAPTVWELPVFRVCPDSYRERGLCTDYSISNKAPSYIFKPDGTADSINNSVAVNYGWDQLPFEFDYAVSIYDGVGMGGFSAGWLMFWGNEDDIASLGIESLGYHRFRPKCPADKPEGGPYNGTGFDDRLPPVVPPEKRVMNLSTHKAEIWLGSSKKEEAIKLYELGASDLLSSSYNALILRAEDTYYDLEVNDPWGYKQPGYLESVKLMHETYHKNRDKNIIDQLIDPQDWIYIQDGVPRFGYDIPVFYDMAIRNESLQDLIDGIYNRTINLTVLDKDTQIIHLKTGLTPVNTLSNTDCTGKTVQGEHFIKNPSYSGQSWEYQKSVTITVKNWEITSTTNTLDTSKLGEGVWNKQHIERKFLTSFSHVIGRYVIDSSGNILPSLNHLEADYRDRPNTLILRPDGNISLEGIFSGNNFEQYNYAVANIPSGQNGDYYSSYLNPKVITTLASQTPEVGYNTRFAALSTNSWWALWDKTHYNSKTERLSSIVGYEKNISQIGTDYGLAHNLDYSQVNNAGGSEGTFGSSYLASFLPYRFEYLTNVARDMIPSNIKSFRDKKFNGPNIYNNYKTLINRKDTKEILGLNFYFASKLSQWTDILASGRNDGSSSNVPYTDYLAYPYFSLKESKDTRESQVNIFNRLRRNRIDTNRWSNNLWAQFIYMGEIKVDVDSYQKVKYTLPTNPSQYIKFSTYSTYTNDEFPFTTANYTTDPILMEPVLSPGTLDITKQVKITKPTNVDLDPNMSFLVYLYPFVEVTKKKKTI